MFVIFQCTSQLSHCITNYFHCINKKIYTFSFFVLFPVEDITQDKLKNNGTYDMKPTIAVLNTTINYFLIN